MKKFFTRNNTKRNNNEKQLHLDLKEERESSSLSDKSLRVLSSNNVTNYKLEEYYYVLINCIVQGLNKNFINVFQKMQKKIDINQQVYEGNTLLIFSTKEGNFAITKYLCSQGADVNIQNDEGNTALHFAIANQFFSIVDVLKASGAKEDIANNKGFTPWDCIEHEL
jgi:ankyrin repeat protein